ncbi:hypothetical protein JoomaDRAFT_1230 [Galbibacter orientalis DSM 19592]|uniref:Nucleotidyltransferase family protein n=1 Tax=Galbibacter orientalis DSM 19592 TaxID=926559 RepID=I3C3Q5_9FLAO|nr:hypothetical protein JoomaDRAFT_1230 [Galbibacter orientalis DSM 19592]
MNRIIKKLAKLWCKLDDSIDHLFLLGSFRMNLALDMDIFFSYLIKSSHH